MNDYRKIKLNQILSDPQQSKAYFSKGNTTVIAGPGSGKTSILTLKILKLLENDIIEPQGIGCITYSREAAREIRDRLQLLGYKPHGNSFFGTVHSFCIAEVLVPFAKLYNYFDLPLPIKIASNKDRNNVFRESLRELRFDTNDVNMTEMNRERKIGIIGQSQIEIPSYDIALQVAAKYEEILHNKGLIDFDDIVNYSTILIQNEEFVRKCIEAKFPWLLIDEYQDLGKPLHEIVLTLLIKTKIRIFAVGDPDQFIYGFQGAVPAYLEELSSFNNKINKIVLLQNYRSNQEIINASEIVLEQNRGYKAGTRQKERAEFKFHVCEAEMSEQFLYLTDTLIPQFT
ncbi:MAG: ATP-dependent helicase, partial [Spirochaetales bacterium]|nr:ATP-dependent helicase [Spirochaetales bacterium]